MDNVYWQKWDFTTNWWQARMFGDHLRWFLFAGRDLPEIRAAYMELTGRPPVPPRKAFGLWTSEFGYKNFGRIDHAAKAGLRRDGFPVDGFVLDLNWFGGIPADRAHAPTWAGSTGTGPARGRPNNNEYSFPNAGAKVQDYAGDRIGLCAIEEVILARGTDTFSQLPAA